jgi:PTS system mannose-specific IID component
MKKKIGKFALFRVFLRLLFIQGLLNRRGMQNLGLASALSETGGKLLSEEDNALLIRHLSYFNSNPNFVPLIVGGLIKLEEQRLEGKPVGDNDIAYFKKALASPFAAMGDMLFVGNLKPLALTFACIFAIYNFPIGLLAIFLFYNLTIISCRFWGLYFGYAKGWELVEVFSGPKFPRALAVIQGVGASVGGTLVGVVFHRFPEDGRWMLVLGGTLTAITLYLLKRDVPASWFAIILFPASVFITLLLG